MRDSFVVKGDGAVPHVAGDQHQPAGFRAQIVLGLQRRGGGNRRLAETDPASFEVHFPMRC